MSPLKGLKSPSCGGSGLCGGSRLTDLRPSRNAVRESEIGAQRDANTLGFPKGCQHTGAPEAPTMHASSRRPPARAGAPRLHRQLRCAQSGHVQVGRRHRATGDPRLLGRHSVAPRTLRTVAPSEPSEAPRTKSSCLGNVAPSTQLTPLHITVIRNALCPQHFKKRNVGDCRNPEHLLAKAKAGQLLAKQRLHLSLNGFRPAL